MLNQTLAHYRITGHLGAGGMGEVWRATDSKLGREVALKMLPAEFSRDTERMARFQREAQVLASLNHPGIGAIYGLEEVDGARFLVLELIEGPTLLDRIRSGPLPPEEALTIARRIAEAVEFAHEHGVVHRDLKPANVKVTDDDRVKVLDFGLAKAMADPASSSPELGASADSPTISPTMQSPITGALTGANVILGTAAYMSPEQARGKAIDKRSDIWSFGVIVLEMLTGRRLFEGETVSDTIASILKTEPDWAKLPPATPPRLVALLKRCLTRDPRQRLRDIGDARIELERILAGEDAAAAPDAAAPESAAPRRGLPGIPFLAGAAVLGALAGILLWSRIGGPSADAVAPSASRLSIVVPEDLEIGRYTVSPDGKTLALEATRRVPGTGAEEFGLYLRDLDDYELRPVPDCQSLRIAAFSPDGRWIAFVAPEAAASTRLFLWKVPVDLDAPPVKLTDWRDDWEGLHWLPDGDLLTGAPGAIIRVPSDGRPPRQPVPIVAEGFDIETTLPPAQSAACRLPDERHILSTIEFWGERGYQQKIVALDIETGQARVVLDNGANPALSGTGHLLFGRGTALLAVPFDPERLEVTGGPTPLANDLRISYSWQHGGFNLATEGTLVYLPGGFVGDDRRLLWMDREFREISPWSDERLALERGPTLSPDGQRVAVVFADPEGVYDIWMSEPDRPVFRKWLEDPHRDCVPNAWSPDGTQLVYQSRTTADTRHLIRALDGTESTLLFTDREVGHSYEPSALVDDDSALLVIHQSEGGSELAIFRMEDADDGPPDLETVLSGVQYARLSPDERWIAYRSDASGRPEIYVRRWNGNGKVGPERRVSSDGATVRRFTSGLWWYSPPDGGPREIWFLDGRDVVSVTLTEDAGEARLSRPRRIAEWKREYRNMAVHPDGRVLLCLFGELENESRQLQVVRGWQSALTRTP